MCSQFSSHNMENYHGDLADIIRGNAAGAVAGSSAPGATSEQVTLVVPTWQFQESSTSFPMGIEEPPSRSGFGDPFCSIGDPLLNDLDIPPGSGFFNATGIIKHSGLHREESSAGLIGTAGDGVNSDGTNNILPPPTHRHHHRQLHLDDENLIKRSPCNIFSSILQISPTAKLPMSPRGDSPVVAASPRGLKPPSLVPADTSKSCLLDNTGLQISSPRNTGIKRRKSQAKKVVCIPAPAPANSRPSGEVVPSDLWAWRKYGQKPIKGSPYPRGYYRCSSSKGCSARKQVERSRTDPNMLVITYTSEHNHPWPTQRNALAGSTRSQTSKSSSSASKTTPISTSDHTQNPGAVLKEEEKDQSHIDCASPQTITENQSTCAVVKEEFDGSTEKQMVVEVEDDVDQFGDDDHGFLQSYKPALPDASNQTEDFFADLDEIETDPLNLLFTQGFSGDIHHGRDQKVATLDPFSFYDWSGNNSDQNSNSAKRDL